MITILPLNPRTLRDIRKHGLTRKFEKQCALLSQNFTHPSLNVERLEPKDEHIYSFRIDLRYRALFVFEPEYNAIEILAVTMHYQ
mgnify:CR=1 FL=1